jgi:hypothetical protein
MAGESAEEVARRSREKAERMLRRAAMFEKGAQGERAVQAVLAQLPPEWTVFHDLRWPGRLRANVDHLVIGPGGVFVVDTKNWSGTVTITDGVLRQNGRSRHWAVDSVRDAATAVAGLVPTLSPDAFVPVLCFVGDSGIHANLDGVLTCRADSLVTMLLTRPTVLSPERLEFLRFELDVVTGAATGPPDAPPAAAATPAIVAPIASGLEEKTSDRTAPGRHRGPVRRPRMSGVIRRVFLGFAHD